MFGAFVFDAGGTLGRFTRPSARDILRELSVIGKDEDRAFDEAYRRTLHCSPVLAEDVILSACGALLIERADWPRPMTWHRGGFELFRYTRQVLADLQAVYQVPMVVLSNVPVTYEPRMRDLQNQLSPYISRVYTSYEQGMRKPDPRLWWSIARDLDVEPGRIVHVGDQWTNDVLGAWKAGCLSIHLAARHAPPPQATWPDGVGPNVVKLGTNLCDVLPALREGFTEPDTEGEAR